MGLGKAVGGRVKFGITAVHEEGGGGVLARMRMMFSDEGGEEDI